MTDKEFFKRLAMHYLISKTKPEDYYYIDEDEDRGELDSFLDIIFYTYVGVGVILLLLVWWIL